MINQDIYYTDTKGNSIFAKIFTLEIYIEPSYVNILTNFCYNQKHFFLNNKQQFNNWLDPLESALWHMIEVKGGRFTDNFELLRNNTNKSLITLSRAPHLEAEFNRGVGVLPTWFSAD